MIEFLQPAEWFYLGLGVCVWLVVALLAYILVWPSPNRHGRALAAWCLCWPLVLVWSSLVKGPGSIRKEWRPNSFYED